MGILAASPSDEEELPWWEDPLGLHKYVDPRSRSPIRQKLRQYREEDTRTIEQGRGWRNVEGPMSARAGMPVPHYYPFEKTLYPNQQEAVGSAIQRMLLQNYADRYWRNWAETGMR